MRIYRPEVSRNQTMDVPHADVKQAAARGALPRSRRAAAVIGALIGAVAIAGSAVALDGAVGDAGPEAMLAAQPQRTAERTQVARRTSPPMPDDRSVSREARKSYADFWKALPKEKADALERELEELEGRARRGDDVSREMERLRRDQPQLFQISNSIQTAKWMVASDGGTVHATCTGLGWIGRNGRLRCIGRLTT